MRRSLIGLALVAALCCTGCSTLNTTKTDMLQAADDMTLAADKVDSGELDAKRLPPLLREHADTLRGWAGD